MPLGQVPVTLCADDSDHKPDSKNFSTAEPVIRRNRDDAMIMSKAEKA